MSGPVPPARGGYRRRMRRQALRSRISPEPHPKGAGLETVEGKKLRSLKYKNNGQAAPKSVPKKT